MKELREDARYKIAGTQMPHSTEQCGDKELGISTLSIQTQKSIGGFPLNVQPVYFDI